MSSIRLRINAAIVTLAWLGACCQCHCQPIPELDTAWDAYRKGDFGKAEGIYFRELEKCGTGYTEKNKLILERLAALYYRMELTNSAILERIKGHCGLTDEEFLWEQLITRFGRYSNRSTEIRKMLRLPEPPPLPPAIKEEQATGGKKTSRRSLVLVPRTNSSPDRWKQYKSFRIEDIHDPAGHEAVANTKRVWQEVGMSYYPTTKPIYGWRRGPKQPFEKTAQEIANNHTMDVKEVIELMENSFLIESSEGKLLRSEDTIYRSMWLGAEVAVAPHPFHTFPTVVLMKKDGGDPESAHKLEATFVR